MARVSQRFPSAVAVVGFALLSLTPAAPKFLRDFDLLFVHVYRLFDFAVKSLRSARGPVAANGASAPSPEESRRIVEGLRRWDAVLLSGARELVPDRPRVLARIVDVEVRTRRLLIDAGPDVKLAAGDPVVAGETAVGRVLFAHGGVAVVETPWSPDARFAAMCVGDAGAEDIRFVSRGLARDEFSASVVNPERREGLRADAEVRVPDVSDLLPDSVAALPPQLRLGRLEVDQDAERRGGKRAYCVRPVLDLALLDAVAVILDSRPPPRRASGFEFATGSLLTTGVLSSFRDGRMVVGADVAEGAAAVVDDRYAGLVDAALFRAGRVVGLSDPGVLTNAVAIPAAGDPFPVVLQAMQRWKDVARLRVARCTSGRALAAGDLLITAGRGAHTPRGLFIGRVAAADGGTVDLAQPGGPGDTTAYLAQRSGFPANPWKE